MYTINKSAHTKKSGNLFNGLRLSVVNDEQGKIITYIRSQCTHGGLNSRFNNAFKKLAC